MATDDVTVLLFLVVGILVGLFVTFGYLRAVLNFDEDAASQVPILGEASALTSTAKVIRHAKSSQQGQLSLSDLTVCRFPSPRMTTRQKRRRRRYTI